MSSEVRFRGEAVGPFLAMDVLRAAVEREAEGRDIAHLEVGQPGAPAPQAVREAARRALDARLGYTEAAGIRPLREAIARDYKLRYGVEVDPNRIFVTTGSSAGFVLAFLSTIPDHGTVVLPTPGYPAYPNILRALHYQVSTLPLEPSDGWRLTAAALEVHLDAKPAHGLIAASPSNPAGTIVPADELARLTELCAERDVAFISDEIYHRLVYAGTEQTALAFSDNAIVINSFSKYYCMTGWRIGWMVVPETLIRPIERLAQNIYICPPAPSQHAALAAFDATDELEAVKAGYLEARQRLLSGLAALGIDKVLPADGAFYVFADIGHLTNDSTEFARTLLYEADIAVTPGEDFDADRGKRFIRFSYAGGLAEVEKALTRLSDFLDRGRPR